MPLYKALYGFNEKEGVHGQLSFSVGDFIELVQQNTTDWYTGRLCKNNTTGLFPAAYVTEVTAAPAPPPPTAAAAAPASAALPAPIVPARQSIPQKTEVAPISTAKLSVASSNGDDTYDSPPDSPVAPEKPTVKALYAFNDGKTVQNQLSFKVGDMIDVMRKDTDDWWTGKLANGQVGLFPAKYTQAVSVAADVNAFTPDQTPASSRKVSTQPTSLAVPGAPGGGRPSLDERPQQAQAASAPSSPSSGPTAAAVTPGRENIPPSLAMLASVAEIPKEGAFKAGFLMKNKHMTRENNWKARWFVLKDGRLMYYNDPVDSTALGTIELSHATISKGGHVTMSDGRKRPFVFKITTAHNDDYLLQAISQENLQSWIQAVSVAITESQNRKPDKSGRIKRGFFSFGKSSNPPKRAETLQPASSALEAKLAARPSKDKLEKMGVIQPTLFGARLDVTMQRSNGALPIVVERCVNHLEATNAVKIAGIFRISGGTTAIQNLRCDFDQGKNVDLTQCKDVHAIAGVLKLYLRELPEAVMTFGLYQEWVDLSRIDKDQRAAAAKAIAQRLPPAHFACLKYICMFLNRVTQYSAENRMDSGNLAIVFGPTLLQPDPTKVGLDQQLFDSSRQVDCVETLIANAPFVFGA